MLCTFGFVGDVMFSLGLICVAKSDGSRAHTRSDSSGSARIPAPGRRMDCMYNCVLSIGLELNAGRSMRFNLLIAVQTTL